MNPWEVLGLPVGTLDAVEVRRAYAEAIRAKRPDSDPEGFRQARDAYELLRSACEGRIRLVVSDEPDGSAEARAPATQGPDETAPLPPPPPDLEPPSVSDEEKAAWAARLSDGVAAARRGGPPEALRALLLRMAEETPVSRAGVELWEHAVPEALRDGDPPGFASLLGETDLVGVATCPAVPLAEAMLDRSFDQGDWTRAARLASAAVERAVLAPNLRVAGFFYRVALGSALEDPAVSRALCDHLYRTVAPDDRRALDFATADLWANAGEQMARWRPETRALVAGALHRGEWTRADVNQRGARRLRRALRAIHPESSAGVLVSTRLNALAQWSDLGVNAATPRAVKATSRWPDLGRGAWFLAIFVLLFVTRLPGFLKGTSDRPSRSSPVRSWKPRSDVPSPLREEFVRWLRRRPGETLQAHQVRMSTATRRVQRGDSIESVLADDPAPQADAGSKDR